MVITEAVLAKVATAVRDIDPTLQTVIVAGGGTDDGVLGYDDLIAEPGDAPQPVDIPNDSPGADHVHLRHHRAGPRARCSPTPTSPARR